MTTLPPVIAPCALGPPLAFVPSHAQFGPGAERDARELQPGTACFAEQDHRVGGWAVSATAALALS